MMRATTLSSSSSEQKNHQEQKLLFDPLVVCGPSGVGKGTIIDSFMQRCQSKFVAVEEELNPMNNNSNPPVISFGFSVSHTTRQPREGEVDGVHYTFTTVEAMQKDIAENKFVEYAQVHGNLYGTSWQAMLQVQSTGKRCLLDIDVQGVQRLKQGFPGDADSSGMVVWNPRYLFIAPPSLETLEARLRGRGTESPEALQRRIGNAKYELEYGLQEGNFDAIVVNDDLELAVLDFERAVEMLYQL
jgi:guanylate kinase